MKRFLLPLVVCFLAVTPALAEQALVAVAANFVPPFREVAMEFEKVTGHTLQVASGSSGAFFTQIKNGAPFDVFCSADLAYPRKLADEGFALPDSEFVYAIGHIVAWVPSSSPIQLTGADALRDPSIRHIAIANPQHAPYGKAAEAALRSLGLYDQVKDKLVYGENVSQALQYVETGSAEIGIVPPSIVKGGRSWEVPLEAYPKMEQGGIIVKSSRHAALAQEFRTFLLSEQGRSILKRFGFYLPV